MEILTKCTCITPEHTVVLASLPTQSGSTYTAPGRAWSLRGWTEVGAHGKNGAQATGGSSSRSTPHTADANHGRNNSSAPLT